eukprot:4265438-Pyramimonas_sp.AAC.1
MGLQQGGERRGRGSMRHGCGSEEGDEEGPGRDEWMGSGEGGGLRITKMRRARRWRRMMMEEC